MTEVEHDLAEILSELNARFAGRAAGAEREGLIEAELRAICAARGLRIAEVAWSDGEFGRVVDVRLAPEAGEVVVHVAREQAP